MYLILEQKGDKWPTLVSIGKGAALALLEHGARVTIVSSSDDNVKRVIKEVNNPNFNGIVGTENTNYIDRATIRQKLTSVTGNVRDENSYTEALRSLAPVDHLVYSGVDKIIRGAIAEADLDEAKHYFGVKFWGSALTGKSINWVGQSC